MKKILALAIMLSFAGSAIAAQATYTQSLVNKVANPMAQKEVQLKNQKEAYEKQQKAKQEELAKKKAAQQKTVEKKKQALKDLLN